MLDSALRAAASHHRELAARLPDYLPALTALADACARCLRRGGALLFCGNGGSAAQAQHLAAEITGRFRRDRPGMAAVALCADTAALTAVANDFGYEEVFARQVEALGRPGDGLLALSTSGRSPNILRALETAHSRGLFTTLFTGERGDPPAVDHLFRLPGSAAAPIQEGHLVLGHLLCLSLDEITIKEDS